MGILIIILFIIICLVILSIPSGLTYGLYRYLKIKGEIPRKIGLAIFLVTTIFMVIYSIKFMIEGGGFGPEYETVEIKQNLGGKLICESVYYADHHSWQYNIDYKYIDSKKDTFDFKNDSYYGRTWDKDEQIQKYNDCLILKTGAFHGSDRLILKNIHNDSTKLYDIDNEFIEKDSLWRSQNIQSLLDYCCSEAFIDEIQGNKISLAYKFRTN